MLYNERMEILDNSMQQNNIWWKDIGDNIIRLEIIAEKLMSRGKC